MILYGQTIEWTDFWGQKTKISVTGCSSLEIAKQIALEDAKEMGWTPYKCWQWWRWHDTKIKE
jgi:hypothetical protein